LRCFLLFLCVFYFQYSWGQSQDAWVYLKDKPNKISFLENPLRMLSPRAIARRKRTEVALDIQDVPMDAEYLKEIIRQDGIVVLAKSKWLNAVHVQGTFENISSLLALDFVESTVFANKELNKKTPITKKEIVPVFKDKLAVALGNDYGNAAAQLEQLKGDVLHQNGFKGEGMLIAVMDAGFPGVDQLSAFKHLFDNGKLLGGYNFVDRNQDIYNRNSHGQMVLSTMAAILPNEFIGTAPEASYYLFITEDAENETPLEESLWVEAAEKADSLGVDIINTSLGYTIFDNAAYNHTYADLDGKTAFMSRGATVAFSRGMLLVNSAGNSGNNPWKYIGVPADSEKVLSIGAVDVSGTIAGFSSYGPTPDNRIKPTVCAQGANAYLINTSGTVSTANGTSFSSPIIAGVIACLWQAFPTMTNEQLTMAIKKSAHLYDNPTAQEGYGIPNFENASAYLESLNSAEPLLISEGIYPNPSDEKMNVPFKKDEVILEVSILTPGGKLVLKTTISNDIPTVDVTVLKSGMYFIQVQSTVENRTYKLIKN